MSLIIIPDPSDPIGENVFFHRPWPPYVNLILGVDWSLIFPSSGSRFRLLLQAPSCYNVQLKRIPVLLILLRRHFAVPYLSHSFLCEQQSGPFFLFIAFYFFFSLPLVVAVEPVVLPRGSFSHFYFS